MATRKRPAAPVKRAPPVATWGSGNVFADLGLKNPEEMLARAALLHRLALLIEARGLTQAATAKLLGLKQPDVSALLAGRFPRRFSTDRLMRFLVALDHDVEIVVRPRHPAGAPARISVAAG